MLASRCFTRSRETQYEILYLSDDIPFVGYGGGIVRTTGGKARMLHWLETPEEVGRRLPEDLVSRPQSREVREFLENRAGKWEDLDCADAGAAMRVV